MKNNKYILVFWPESQDYMEYEGYMDNSVVHPSEDGAVFLKEEWMKEVDAGHILKIQDEED